MSATLTAARSPPCVSTSEPSYKAPSFGGLTSLDPREHHRLVEGWRRLSIFGHRCCIEFVLVVTYEQLDVAEMLDRLDRFTRTTAEILGRAGGDLLPAPCLREVPLDVMNNKATSTERELAP